MAILSTLATFGFLLLLGELPRFAMPEWLGWPLALLPPFVFGGLSYRAFGRWLRSRRVNSMVLPGHLRRSASLYLIALVLGLFIALNLSDKGLGLVAPAFVWPFMATLGGILGDASIREGTSHEDP